MGPIEDMLDGPMGPIPPGPCAAMAPRLAMGAGLGPAEPGLWADIAEGEVCRPGVLPPPVDAGVCATEVCGCPIDDDEEVGGMAGACDFIGPAF